MEYVKFYNRTFKCSLAVILLWLKKYKMKIGLIVIEDEWMKSLRWMREGEIDENSFDW